MELIRSDWIRLPNDNNSFRLVRKFESVEVEALPSDLARIVLVKAALQVPQSRDSNGGGRRKKKWMEGWMGLDLKRNETKRSILELIGRQKKVSISSNLGTGGRSTRLCVSGDSF